jgi:aspartate-semialdehyde dehydrogenase
MKEYTVAVAGALGVVGQEMILTLERRKFPVKVLKPLDIRKTPAGRSCSGTKSQGEESCPEAFRGVDIALFAVATRSAAPWRRRR